MARDLAESMGVQGLGYYPVSGFIHVDVRDERMRWIDYGQNRQDSEGAEHGPARGDLAEYGPSSDDDNHGDVTNQVPAPAEALRDQATEQSVVPGDAVHGNAVEKSAVPGDAVNNTASIGHAAL